MPGKAKAMLCDECGAALEERVSTAEEPYIDDGLIGLPGLRLIGVSVMPCPNGHRPSVLFPRMGQLLDAIARYLLKKPMLLSGAELRYLRKYAGIAAQDFAELLDVDPAHLSRVENGRYDSLSRSLDKLSRAIVTAAKQEELTKSVLLELKTEKKAARSKSQTFTLEGTRWRPAA